MDFDRDSRNTDEYFVTAVQIFDCCGVESSGSLRVDALMDKFAPFVKTNKAEFSLLKSLLDPEHSNPDIDVTKLASALHQYSESQKTKVDLDESFNFRCGQVPQDSDSGISTDGLQLLDELQCELREKERLAQQLRSQLDYCDRQHEEALAALAAERDSLRSHLNILREENAALCTVRRDCDEASERLAAAEAALADATRQLDLLRKRNRSLEHEAARLETDKATLQDLLQKSKAECHRINEMYSARQTALREENELVRARHAELDARLADHDHVMQQVLKEKVQLEMELKDMLNRSNQTQQRFDRSIEVSYTEDQMLTALDTLNAESHFISEPRLLDEDSFLSPFKDDLGRPTNMSLFDEIRLSSTYFSNKSRLSFADFNKSELEHSISKAMDTVGTQTDVTEIKPSDDSDRTDFSNDSRVEYTDGEIELNRVKVNVGTQTNIKDPIKRNSKEITHIETQTDIKDHTKSNSKEVVNTETQTYIKDYFKIDSCDAEIQTENDVASKGIQTIGMFLKPRLFVKQHRVPFPKAMLFKNDVDTQTEVWECFKPKSNTYTVETQTETNEINFNNNNNQDHKCLECEIARKQKDKLEIDLKYSNQVISEVQEEISNYEDNLACLENIIDEGKDKNRALQSLVQDLTSKIEILQAVSARQGDALGRLLQADVSCVECQTDFDQVSVSTQADEPCTECEKNKAVLPHGGLKRFFWDPLKCLFQLFAVICFVCAVCVLCGVSQRAPACRAAPWRWLQPHDLVDLLFRVEYTADVPM